VKAQASACLLQVLCASGVREEGSTHVEAGATVMFTATSEPQQRHGKAEERHKQGHTKSEVGAAGGRGESGRQVRVMKAPQEMGRCGNRGAARRVVTELL